MAIIIAVSKHTPEICPANNKDHAKAIKEFSAKIGELTKKHGVKIVGMWIAMAEHAIIQVFEAPNFDAIQELSMEPEVDNLLRYNTTKYKMAVNFQEAVATLK